MNDQTILSPGAAGRMPQFSGDAAAGLVLLLLVAILFWWGFAASARTFARWRHADRGVVLLTLVEARSVGGGMNRQLIDVLIVLWCATAASARFELWRKLKTGMGSCAARPRAVRP